ncbi:uncharacterized protein LOC129606914 [Condylostylus longicornis]|uniref:uncharacterized protein LOC129606914 n=1 Tax=Condylostylus longicornis TaxID=2530218 RepID=UPI00244DA3C2|nr:uncharacterized protein LOC129606914 [Condylostylus longicornis]
MAASPVGFGSAKTTTAQYAELINLLTDRQDIAHGFTRRSKEEVNAFWEYVSSELNKLGPPTKDTTSWRKVWSDYKSSVKKKLIRNKRNIEITDGRLGKLSFLSELEQKVVNISGLEKYIKNVDGKVSISFDENKNVNDDYMNVDPPSPNDDLDDLLNRDGSIERSIRADSEDRISQYDSKIEESVSLLKSQISLQKNVYESLANWSKQSGQNQKKITNDLKKVYRGVYRTYLVQKGTFREMQRHNREMEKIMKKKLEIKEQLLQLKKSKN